MDRYNILKRNIFGSFTVKGLSILVNFFTIPAYLSYFEDKSLLGLWLAINGVFTWIINFDLGIGNGLRNKLVEYLDKKNLKKARVYISSAYFMLGIISFAFSVVGYFLIQIIDWSVVLNISTQYVSETTLKLVMSFNFLGVILYFVLKLVSSILLSMEKVAIVNFLQLLTNVSNLAYIIIFKEENAQTALINLSVVYIISLNFPYLVASMILFFGKLKLCCPSIKYVDKKIAANITFLGGKFFFIQLMLMIINSTNEFLITNIYGPEYVVDYQIYYKIFYLIVTLFSLVTNPIWSNIARASTNQDYVWIKKLQNKLRVLSILCSFFMIVIVFMFPMIVRVWLNDNNFDYTLSYGVIFAAFSIVMIFVLSETAIANGLSRLKVQLILFTIGGVLKIPLTYGCSMLNMSWISVVIVNIVVLIPLVFVQVYDTNKFVGKQLNHPI